MDQNHDNSGSEAFRLIFDALDLTDMYCESRDEHAALGNHPFGLEINLPCRVFHGEFFLVAFPGYSDDSVRNMALVLQHAMRSCDVFGLRIIKVPAGTDRQAPDRMHDLYFELTTRAGTFLCGGCNGCSGARGSAGRRLETIFRTVGKLYGIAVKEVALQSDGCQIGSALSNLYEETMRSRRRYA